MLNKKQYDKKIKELVRDYPESKNWATGENRWLYHEQAIKWLKELDPKTVLEIGALGVKLREDSKTLDNGSWKVGYEVDYKQDVRKLDIPYFDCIVALRVLHHYPESFNMIFTYLKEQCEILILALPKEFPVKGYSEMKECNDSNIYLWK